MLKNPLLLTATILLAVLASNCGRKAENPAPPAANTPVPASPAPKRSVPQTTPTFSASQVAEAEARLVAEFKRVPINRGVSDPEAQSRRAIFIMDLKTEESIVAIVQVGSNVVHVGSPSWSNDGRQILFDAMTLVGKS
jgi:hypothetical protein